MVENRIYRKDNSIIFRKTNDNYGGLSNMASGFPINWAIIRIKSSEALYQSLRYPHRFDIQKEILMQSSPMTAKMISKKYYKESRKDWDEIKFKIMRFCLELKLINNWENFFWLLKSTDQKDIVEYVPNDQIWGAKDKVDFFEGPNALGRLLMGLRENYIYNPLPKKIFIPKIEKINIFGIDVKEINTKVPNYIPIVK